MAAPCLIPNEELDLLINSVDLALTRGRRGDVERWAPHYSVKVPLEIRRHECAKPQPQAEPWLLVSVLTLSDEPLPEPVAAMGGNARTRAR